MGRRGCRFLGNFNSLNPNPSSQPATRAARLSKSVIHSLSEISIAKRGKFRGSRRGPVAHRHCAPPGKFERSRKLDVRRRPKADAVKAVSALAHTLSNCYLTAAASGSCSGRLDVLNRENRSRPETASSDRHLLPREGPRVRIRLPPAESSVDPCVLLRRGKQGERPRRILTPCSQANRSQNSSMGSCLIAPARSTARPEVTERLESTHKRT
jgi:hypothetical protein